MNFIRNIRSRIESYTPPSLYTLGSQLLNTTGVLLINVSSLLNLIQAPQAADIITRASTSLCFYGAALCRVSASPAPLTPTQRLGFGLARTANGLMLSSTLTTALGGSALLSGGLLFSGLSLFTASVGIQVAGTPATANMPTRWSGYSLLAALGVMSANSLSTLLGLATPATSVASTILSTGLVTAYGVLSAISDLFPSNQTTAAVPETPNQTTEAVTETPNQTEDTRIDIPETEHSEDTLSLQGTE